MPSSPRIARQARKPRRATRPPAARPFRVGRSRTGLGLFATETIERGGFIVEYKGRRITHAEAARREARGARYMFELDARWTIDGSSRRNLARYVNHSCRPNAESDLENGKLILRAIKRIPSGQEITSDYGKEYFDLFIARIGCKCEKCLSPRRS
ncbi:MAG: SET domain-containing protein [Hyphomicrobiales bacterium]|nr:SET domain-containing protein [Hyphomicrobiales bacterium]